MSVSDLPSRASAASARELLATLGRQVDCTTQLERPCRVSSRQPRPGAHIRGVASLSITTAVATTIGGSDFSC
eukprot:scaffold141973_cov31-Tisochrysis_lutea.AAC.5